MKILSAVLGLGGVTLFVLACANHQETSQNPAMPKGTLLVKQLPAGVEGVELKGGWLRLKSGYKFEKKLRSQFSVARISDGHGVLSGGCGCTGGTCDPKSEGGIIVCSSSGDCVGHCGLALTAGGTRTAILRY